MGVASVTFLLVTRLVSGVRIGLHVDTQASDLGSTSQKTSTKNTAFFRAKHSESTFSKGPNHIGKGCPRGGGCEVFEQGEYKLTAESCERFKGIWESTSVLLKKRYCVECSSTEMYEMCNANFGTEKGDEMECRGKLESTSSGRADLVCQALSSGYAGKVWTLEGEEGLMEALEGDWGIYCTAEEYAQMCKGWRTQDACVVAATKYMIPFASDAMSKEEFCSLDPRTAIDKVGEYSGEIELDECPGRWEYETDVEELNGFLALLKKSMCDDTSWHLADTKPSGAPAFGPLDSKLGCDVNACSGQQAEHLFYEGLTTSIGQCTSSETHDDTLHTVNAAWQKATMKGHQFRGLHGPAESKLCIEDCVHPEFGYEKRFIRVAGSNTCWDLTE